MQAKALAQRLGLSGSMMRRHVATYEEVFGALPRDERNGRYYDEETAERLEAALDASRTGKALSVKAALLALREGVQLESVTPPERGATLEAIVAALGELSERLEVIEGFLSERDDLERRNRHLLAELERRDGLEQRAKRRPWWRWW